MKICSKCGKEKDLSEYHKDKQKKDGKDTKCKSCKKLKNTKWRGDNREKIPKNCPEYAREWYKNNHGKRAEYSRRYSANNPHKIKAHQAVRIAIASGELVRCACVVCGEGNTHAHHEDYSKPLDVIWFCFKHHMEYHRGSLTVDQFDGLTKQKGTR